MKYKIKIDEYKTIKYYYENGRLHRDEDNLAVIYSDGCRLYYKNGEHHRDGDKPAVIESNGYKSYYKNGVKIK